MDILFNRVHQLLLNKLVGNYYYEMGVFRNRVRFVLLEYNDIMDNINIFENERSITISLKKINNDQLYMLDVCLNINENSYLELECIDYDISHVKKRKGSIVSSFINGKKRGLRKSISDQLNGVFG